MVSACQNISRNINFEVLSTALLITAGAWCVLWFGCLPTCGCVSLQVNPHCPPLTRWRWRRRDPQSCRTAGAAQFPAVSRERNTMISFILQREVQTYTKLLCVNMGHLEHQAALPGVQAHWKTVCLDAVNPGPLKGNTTESVLWQLHYIDLRTNDTQDITDSVLTCETAHQTLTFK